MKKFLSSIFLLVFLFGGIWLGTHKQISQTYNYRKEVYSSSATSESVSAIPTSAPSKPGIPKMLIIPKLNVNATVEEVGLDTKGRMDVPKDPQEGGWYNLGFRPGEQGSAVIDGHLDTVTGAPAVFYDLSSLQTGDVVKVIDDNSKTYTFTVSDKQTYDYDKVPLQQVFASTDAFRLNLITCRGIFDKATKNYSKRIVVYTQLQK